MRSQHQGSLRNLYPGFPIEPYEGGPDVYRRALAEHGALNSATLRFVLSVGVEERW
ncbi:hypothetical protein [Nonomuraea sp. SYSU D8015]|uniref:hypothetical protein n=1 Tax=Nonomuraea sp. SYSU D8015 TaxID=2593644 RepID=UPI001661812C|nr:hypothetical protein [Nonomuraea sp. SYSU D8015]